MASKRCPFCGNPALSKTVGDAYNLDCSFCEIQIEISKAAYATPCADVEGVLGGVRKRMEQGASRPRIDRTAMQKTGAEVTADRATLRESRNPGARQHEKYAFARALRPASPDAVVLRECDARS